MKTSGAEILVHRPRLHPKSSLPDLDEAEAFFASAAGVPRVILLSSAAAHAPHHHNPGYVSESYRSQGTNPVAEAWRELEARFAARLPQAERIVLRPATVAARDSDDFFCRLLSSRAAVVPPGYDPALQFLAPEDLAAAVACAVEHGAGKPGDYHVAPRGALSLRQALRLAGVRRLPLRWIDRSGWSHYLRHNWTVSGRRIETELGFVPRETSAEAVHAAFGRDKAPAAAEHDDFGLDAGYIAAYERTLFRFLYDLYWRVEVQGLENVPRQGRAVLTGLHRGFMPWDGVMALVAVHRSTGRIPRFLIHPCLVKPPFLANYMTKLGGILACQENADWVLGRDELLGMFPEGIHGAFTPYRDAYKLGKFGRDEYVKMALRNRAPIVPFVTAGSAEIYPILGRLDWKWVKRATEWLYLPVCPNFPFPGLPLPSKWHTRFLEPIHLERRYGPEAADDPAAVRAISSMVRARMEEALHDLLRRRRSIFFGSIFEEAPRAGETSGGEQRE
ncbi:MAG TPA: 1-acyl-sn-glycerol-3-phosphate acyltransferase [Thermoanaerobaculia bacterium]|jgi:1-acyl-sn-glycerol-3-phosphate acyltransferase|nr:1-acyl-sn-glycerol-3-phosphate acyltransferase [Thermoanaerobaculia bacterium]